MTYSVKEIFYTLQGEGAQAGRPAVFCRFSGCNLWSGREVDRQTAECRFCDTDFIGTNGTDGGKFITAEALAEAIARLWPAGVSQNRFVVCTGGEPLLQLDAGLIAALHTQGFQVAVETNGTIAAPQGIDWICVSPKAGTALVQTKGHELKLVYPQANLDPGQLEALAFENFFLQPMDGLASEAQATRQTNTRLALAYCLAHPQWRLSLQTHKILGIA